MPFVTIHGKHLEIQRIAASADGGPTLVFLHEGLGSVALWRDFPARVGAAIALIHAGDGKRPVRGLVLEAPHVFVEDVTVASIAEAKEAWHKTDLRQRLARYHGDVDGAFMGWNDIWLAPAFRDWNIEA